MNKKGFAISVVLYTMVLLVIGIFYLLLGIVRNRYTVGDDLKEQVINGIEAGGPFFGNIAYGDVNEDGLVDGRDSVRLVKYVEGTETLGDQAKKNADVNDDGNVDNVDLVLLNRYLADWYENTLPELPIKDYVMYGDVNEDGLVDGRDSVRLQSYIEGTKTLGDQAKKNADVNNDGSVNDTDYQLLLEYLLDVDDGKIPNTPLS